jgi:hypothetical protein
MNINQLIRELSNCSYNINHLVNIPVNIRRGREIIDILNIKLNGLSFIQIPSVRIPSVSFGTINLPNSLWLTSYPDCSPNSPIKLLLANIPNVIPNEKLFNRIRAAVSNINPTINLNPYNVQYNIGFGIYHNISNYLELNLYFHGFLFPEGSSATDDGKIAYPLVGIWDVKGSINYIKPYKEGYCEGNDILCPAENHEHKIPTEEEPPEFRQQRIDEYLEMGMSLKEATQIVDTPDDELNGREFGEQDAGRISITNPDISGSGIAICIDYRNPDRLRICIVQILIINRDEIEAAQGVIAEFEGEGMDISDTDINILFNRLEVACPSIITLKDENGWLFEQLIKI